MTEFTASVLLTLPLLFLVPPLRHQVVLAYALVGGGFLIIHWIVVRQIERAYQRLRGKYEQQYGKPL
jgi:hypothetical protein